MKNTKQNLFNAQNERLKLHYEIHLNRALKKDDSTTTEALKYLREFEIFINFESFAVYNKLQADRYIDYLFEQDYSLSFIDSTVRELKDFLRWLERQKGYRSKVNYNDIDYLNITSNQRSTAKTPEYKKSHSFKKIIKVIRCMPEVTAIQKRDKAIVSLNALCGLRTSELRTVKIKNLIEEDGKYFIYVNPKDMEVKFAKTRHAIFMPLPKDILDNVLNWKSYLMSQGFTKKDPLFPKIPNNFNQQNLLVSNLTSQEIRSNSTLINIFKNSFEKAGFEYINPHNFRHTIIRFAERQTPEFLNAVRQSLGHSSINTTFQSYGELSKDEQRDRISGLKYDFET